MSADGGQSFAPAADDDQLALIHANEHQIIRLVAPAGSGKTQTIIHRMLQLTKTGTRPDRILCLTFDNAAGKALRDKIRPGGIAE
jgi:DNA helicase II / ATP-dependent DNA helicase PcrA